MRGLDVVGADRREIKLDGLIAHQGQMSWWKKGALITGGLVVAVLTWSTIRELLVRREQLRRYGELPVRGRHWKRTLVTGLFDHFSKRK